MTIRYAVETFTPDERAILERHFTNLDGPVFALTNLPGGREGRVVRAVLPDEEVAPPLVPG